MSKIFKVAVLVGSLRRDSLNRKLARALMALAPASLELAIVELADVAMYNADLDSEPPAPWMDLRAAIRAADAVLFVTPEYNRSVPAVLKNAIDVGSRPYGQSAWNGKPAAIVSSSPGAIGAFGANHHLRQSLVFLNMPAMQQPEAYFGHVNDLLEADGEPANDTARKLLRGFMLAFEAWIATNVKA